MMCLNAYSPFTEYTCIFKLQDYSLFKLQDYCIPFTRSLQFSLFVCGRFFVDFEIL